MSTTALQTVHEPEARALTSAQVVAQTRLMQQVMQDVMKENTHYGTIPGCKQPTLYKAGSEVLLTTFRIAVEPEVTDLSTSDAIRYRVRAVGRHQTTGIIVGVGVGECSSDEEKYRWRTAICQEEFDATPEDRRRIKFKKGGYVNGSYDKRAVVQIKQVRAEPADLANTILKMAKKRAQVDLTLTATAASDIFTQDIEDLPEEYREAAEDEEAPAPKVQAPRSKSGNGETKPVDVSGPMTESMLRIVRAKLEANDKTEAALLSAFKVSKIEELRANQINDALAWITQ